MVDRIKFISQFYVIYQQLNNLHKEMPLDSLYEATKFSIEQGIIDMQEKLRRVDFTLTKKNQLELHRELAESILHQQRLYRQEKQRQQLQRTYLNEKMYANAMLKRTTYDPYVNSILYDSGLHEQANLQYYQYQEALRREAQHKQYLKRLQRMKAQNLTLNGSVPYGNTRPVYEENRLTHVSPIKQFSSNKQSLSQSRNHSNKKSPLKADQMYKNIQYDQTLDEDSSALLEKYSKGIRAQQYNRDMEKLVEIQKRLRKIQMQQQSASKSAYGLANQSLVTPYQPKIQQNPHTNRERQNIPAVPARKNIHYMQRPIKIEEQVENNFKESQQIQPQKNRKLQIFQNQKIGNQINKQKNDQSYLRPSMNRNQHPGLQRFDKLVSETRKKYHQPLRYENIRPSSTKLKEEKKRSVSKNNHSALSVLKSERRLSKRQYQQPYTNYKRPRAKSAKQQKSSRSSYQPQNTKKINSRLISLDPATERHYQQIMRKQVNEKIQHRLRLLSCVFKDANMRKERNEIEALQQRFEIQSRGRKQIKSLINNDPKILKKHKMVVS